MRRAVATRRMRPAAVAAGLVAVALLAGCAGSQPGAAPGASPSASPTAQPTADPSLGVVEYGTGSKVVDLYVDPLCPYCKRFEQLSGPLLLSEAEAGSLTLRVHPVSILDRLSEGTRYSTRAAAAVLTVAAAYPDTWPAFLTELFANQPEENSTGLTDAELEALAEKAGTPVTLTGDNNEMQARVTEATKAALSRGIAQVPTVLVDGEAFKGGSQDAAEFESFYRSH